MRATDQIPLPPSLHGSVAILGAGGTLGRAVAEIMARCGIPHVALSRGDCDITRDQDLARLLTDVRPASVVNCAAVTNWEFCEQNEDICTEINGLAVGRLAEACARREIPIVHFSCASVFDGTSLHPYSVDDSAGALCGYGRSKELGETLLKQLPPHLWLLVRTSWLFGEISRDFVGRLLSQAGGEHAISVADDEFGSPTFADDLARAVLLLMVAGATGVWHLSNRGTATWYTFAQAIIRAWEQPAVLWPCATVSDADVPLRLAELPRSSVLDCSKTYNQLGLKLRMWEPALLAYCQRAKQ